MTPYPWPEEHSYQDVFLKSQDCSVTSCYKVDAQKEDTALRSWTLRMAHKDLESFKVGDKGGAWHCRSEGSENGTPLKRGVQGQALSATALEGP